MSRIPYLSFLIPEDAVFWHSLDQYTFETEAGEPVQNVDSEEGANFDMFPMGSAEPLWRELATEEKYIEFDGANDSLKTVDVDSVNVKHIFVGAAFSGATFNDTNGLISPLSAANGILAGATGTTKFFNFSLPSTVYRKSGVPYAASNMQAPMNGVPELVELMYPTGFDLTDLQIGKDRDFTGRLWNGTYYFSIGFPRLITSSVELARLYLYANLRGRFWEALEETLTFPIPEIIFGENIPTYSRFYEVPQDFVTYSHTYADERKTFNQTNTTPPRRWQIEFNNISAAQAQVLDAFSNNVRKIKTFDFYDYKRDRTYSGVRIENYERNHDGHQSWKNNCRFDLVKY